jgi:hypothetical protein
MSLGVLVRRAPSHGQPVTKLIASAVSRKLLIVVDAVLTQRSNAALIEQRGRVVRVKAYAP